MLKRIQENVWGHEVDLKLGAGLRMHTRATYMRLADGRLAVHSPLSVDDDLAQEIDSLGEVRFLIAPNCVHWMSLASLARRYPKARVLIPEGLERKLKGSIAKTEILPTDGVVSDLGEEIRFMRMEGAPAMNERVLLHEASRSLLVSDLMFNIHQSDNFGMRLFLRVVGAWKKTSQSVFWKFLTKDRAAAAQSASKILSWDFERVIVGHGDIVEDDARELTRQALKWMTRGAPPLLAGKGSVIA